MGTSGLPDIHTRDPRAEGVRIYISGKPRVPMVQLICAILSITANRNP